MRPDHGGRLELKLAEFSENSARYALVISTAAAEFHTTADVDAPTGVVQIGVCPSGAPPAWLEALARTLLRTALRNKVSAGEWPRRLTRWRPEPGTRGSEPSD